MALAYLLLRALVLIYYPNGIFAHDTTDVAVFENARAIESSKKPRRVFEAILINTKKATVVAAAAAATAVVVAY